MKNKNWKYLQGVAALCCLAPAAFAVEPCNPTNVVCAPTAMPEGGSTAIYLLAAALTCFVAMFFRSKLVKPAKS
jgi:hypothetical protein